MAYPVLLDIQNRECLVVGAGKIALKKTKELLKNKARVFVVAKEIMPEFYALARYQNITVKTESFAPDYINGKFLVIAATDNPALNEYICREASLRNVLSNSVSGRKYASFMNTAYFGNKDILVAVSSSGKNPSKSLKLKNLIKEYIAQIQG
jgi:siroheme synthase-like protein